MADDGGDEVAVDGGTLHLGDEPAAPRAEVYEAAPLALDHVRDAEAATTCC